MEMIEVRNGVANPRRRKRRNAATTRTATKANPRRKRRRRNPSTTTALVANPRRRRRRNPTTAVARAANPRRRRRRNPVVAVANKRRRGYRRNGIFGDTKSEVKQVASIIGGLVGTKVVGGIVAPYVNNLLAGVGVGKFTTPIVDGVLALTVVPMGAKWVGGDPKLARLGALALVGLDILQMVLPSGFAYSPFAVNGSPVILAGNQGQLVAAATADVANAAIDAANRAAAKVGGGSSYMGGGFDPSPMMGGELNGEF